MTQGGEGERVSFGLVHEKTLDEVTRQLDETSFLLKSWAASEDSDSVRRQELRKTEYAQGACGLLKQIYADTFRSGKQIRLTVAEDGEPVRAHDLRKNAYDLIEVGFGGNLKPGQSILLKTHRGLMNIDQKATNVYFGDYRKYLEVADIARILANGGSLELADEESDADSQVPTE